MGLETYKGQHFHEEQLRINLDLLDEKKELARIGVAAAYQNQTVKYYNKRVKMQKFSQLLLPEIPKKESWYQTWKGLIRLTEW